MAANNRAKICCMGAASLILFVSSDSLAATTHDGRYLDTDISPPFMPRTQDDCTAYHREATEKYQIVSDAHRACKQAAPWNEHGHPAPGGDCSVARCEGIHDSATEMLNGIQQNAAACRSAVATYKAVSTVYDTATSSSSDQTKDSDSKFPSATEIVKMTAKDAYEISRKCDAMRSLADRQACINSVHDYKDNSTRAASGSSIVRAIQDNSSKYHREHDMDMLNTRDSLRKDIDKVGKDDFGEYGSSGYGSSDYGSREYEPSGYGSSDYGSSDYGSREYEPSDYEPGEDANGSDEDEDGDWSDEW